MEIVASRSQSVFRDQDFELTEEDFQILRSRRISTTKWANPRKPYVMARLAYQLSIIDKPHPDYFKSKRHFSEHPWNLTVDWLEANYPNWRDVSATGQGVAA